MHRGLRRWNSKVPESPDRLDPILKVLLELYAHQLEQIDQRVNETWDVAVHSLIKSLSPESKRWPVPAFTVMSCTPSDPVVEVDPHTRFFYKEKREGGQILFFTSIRNERVLAATVKHVLVKCGKQVIDLSPLPPDAPPPPRPRSDDSLSGPGHVYLGIDHTGSTTDFADATLFLNGAPEALKQWRWANWYPGSNFGSFYEDSGFCPGLSGSLQDLLQQDDSQNDWGGLRSAVDVFKPLENSFVSLPERFTSTWEPGPTPTEIADSIARSGGPGEGSLHWIRLDLPVGGDRTFLQRPLQVHFNAFIAVNRNEQTLFKHTGGSRLVELELPEDIDSVLEIIQVKDSGGREYHPVYQIRPEQTRYYYSLEERNRSLVLWLDFSSTIDAPPDAITVTYAVTAGLDANGVSVDKIVDLYENHPGLDAAANITPTMGAIPAKTDAQVVSEATSRLRNRDRALSFEELSNWTKSFDPRITQVQCRNGVEKAERGVRRCIVVTTTVTGEAFHSEDETSLLRQRLGSFLKSRSTVNTSFKIEIVSQ